MFTSQSTTCVSTQKPFEDGALITPILDAKKTKKKKSHLETYKVLQSLEELYGAAQKCTD